MPYFIRFEANLFMMLQRARLIFLFVLWFQSITGQSFHLSHIDVEQGLPASSVRSLLEDQRGFLWVGTFGGGLARFDGTSWRAIPREKTRFSSTINALFEDQEGNVWIGTEKGPGIISASGFVDYDAQSVLSHIKTKVYGFTQGRDKKIYIATHQGLVSFDGKRAVFDTSSGLPSVPIRSVIQSPKGLIVGTQSGVLQWQGKRWEPIPELQVQVNSLWFDSASQTLWVAHAQGLSSYTKGKAKHLTLADDFMGNYATCIQKMKDGSLWIGTLNFPVRFYQGTLERIGEAPFPLNHSIIQCIRQDAHGQIWLGTYGGLDRLNFPPFLRVQYEQMPSMPANHILTLPDSSIWIASDAGAFRYKNHNLIEQITSKEGLPEPGVSMIAWDGLAYWLILPNNPPIRYVNGKLSSPFSNSYPFGATHFVRRLNDGRMIFTANGGALIWDGNTTQFLFSGKDLPMSLVYDVCQDSQGALWFSGSEGVVRWKSGEPIRHYSEEQGLPEKLTYSIRCDALDRIWTVCYGGGLICIQKGKVQPIVAPDARFGQEWMALDINSDASQIWLGGVKGIAQLIQTQKGYTWKAYGPAQGVYGQSVVIDGISRAANGDLWVGTVTGMVCMPMQQKKPTQISPVVYLNEFRADGYLVEGQFPDSETTLSVAAGTQALLLHFAALDLSGDPISHFQYRIEGLHSNFIKSTSGTINLLGLDPGTYSFEIQAINSVGEAGPVLSFSLHIPPLWYQRIWVPWLGLIALLGVALLLFNTWFRRREKELKERARLFERLSSLQLRTLKQNLNPHFLGNALSNLQGLLLTNQTEKAEKYLEDFGQVLKISLANADSEFISLHEEMEFLQFYFSLENERLGNAIQLNLHGLERVNLKEIQVPHLITQPLVENAFKHGFNRTGKGELRVEVDMESSGSLRINLLSDAVGIGNVPGLSGGMGLGLLRQRLDALFGEKPGGWIQWTRLESGQFQVQLILPQGD